MRYHYQVSSALLKLRRPQCRIQPYPHGRESRRSEPEPGAADTHADCLGSPGMSLWLFFFFLLIFSLSFSPFQTFSSLPLSLLSFGLSSFVGPSSSLLFDFSCLIRS